MKKLMVCMAAAVAASMVQAATVTYTPEEYEAKCNAVYELAQVTNLIYAQHMYNTNGLSSILQRKDLVAQANRIDEKLSAVGICSVWYYATSPDCAFRRMGQNAFDSRGAETNCPKRVALARKYSTYASCYWLGRSKVSMEEFVPIMSEMCVEVTPQTRFFVGSTEMNQCKKVMQQLGEKVVKKYLRAQGKSFVTKDGVNPCATYMEALNTALNAPYFEGLNAWLEQMGIAARVDVSKLPTKAEAEKLKEDILNADEDMKTEHQYVLQLCLGVDGYNAFVKDYNGDK